MITVAGGCHCGAVRFEVDAPDEVEVYDCDCSICSMTGFLHLIVPKSRFRLLAGEAELVRYTFGTGVARHLFCRRCGIKSFYVPRSNPDGWSVNLRCLDRAAFRSVSVLPFDGRNWKHDPSLAARSRE
jgi:hypothetical protein